MAWSSSSLLSSRRNGLLSSRRSLLMETLEDRILYTAAPTVTVDMAPNGPGADTDSNGLPGAQEADAHPMLNESFNFSVIFENKGSTTGYAPFIDVKLEKGLDVVGTPTYIGQALTQVGATMVGAVGGSTFVHPYTGETITLAEGEEFRVYDLPFGSFVSGQQPLEVMFTGITDKASEGAFVGKLGGYAINARGGFRLGDTPLDDAAAPTNDLPIISSLYPGTTTAVQRGMSDNGAVFPRVWEVSKAVVIHENETATGHHFPVPWELTVDVADQEKVLNVQLTDVLPNNLQFLPGMGVMVSIHGGAFVALTEGTQWTFVDAHNGTANTADDTEPGGTLTVNLGTITGATGNDVVVRYFTYVPEFEHDDGDGLSTDGDNGGTGPGAVHDPILNPTTGQPNISTNGVAGTGIYDKNGNGTVEGGEGVVTDDLTSTDDLLNNFDNLTDRSLAIQKSVTGNVDTTPTDGENNFIPGNLLTYGLNFQVSDYFTFNNLYMVDKLGDGQTFIGTDIHLDWTENNAPYGIDTDDFIDLGNTLVSNPAANITKTEYRDSADNVYFTTYYNSGTSLVDITGFDTYLSYLLSQGQSATSLDGGQTIIVFNVSLMMGQSAAAAGSPGGAGTLVGGRTFPTGTTGVLSYKAQVNENYIDPPAGSDASIDLRDVITNDVNIYGNVGVVPTGALVGDGSGTSLIVSSPKLVKSVYAVNLVTGPAATTNPVLAAGDNITYKLELTLPISDIEKLTIKDFIPLPKFEATDLVTFQVVKLSTFMGGGSLPPAPGTILLVLPDVIYDALNDNNGPDGGGPLGSTTYPNFAFDAASNSFTVEVGSFDLPEIPANQGLTIAVYFTVRATSVPMADDLLLTNQMVATYTNTGTTTVVDASIVQVKIKEPIVDIYKGVVASDQNGTAPVVSGSTTINFSGTGTAIGASNTAYSGGVQYLTKAAAAAVGALNLTSGNLPDADDIVRFAVVAQNSGSGNAYGVVFSDTIESTYSFVGMKVFDGNGTVLTAGVDYTVNWVGNTFTISVPFLNRADTGATPTTDGSNSIVVLYDVRVVSTAQANSTTTNTAKLSAYYSVSSVDPEYKPENNFIPSGKSDTALVKILPPKLLLELDGTQITDTGNDAAKDATIGEEVYYKLTITIPEGKTLNMVLRDELNQLIADKGLVITDFTSVLYSAGLIPANATYTEAYVLNFLDANYIGSDTFNFNFGTFDNTDTANGTPETITITYKALVTNVGSNVNGTQLENRATLDYQYTDVNSNAVVTPIVTAAPQLSSSAAIAYVVEPRLTIDKQVGKTELGTYYPANTSLDGVFDASDEVYYKIIIRNPGGPTAWDIDLTDTFPGIFFTGAGFTLVSALNTGSGTLVGFVGAGSFNITGNNLTTVGNIDIKQNGEITLIIKGTLLPTVQPNDLIQNTARVTWTSVDGAPVISHTLPLPGVPAADSTERGGTGGINSYVATDPANITVRTPKVDLLWKDGTIDNSDTSLGTSNGSTVVIDEHAYFDILVELPEGTTPNLKVSFTLPSGLSYKDFDLISQFEGNTALTTLLGAGGVNGVNVALTPTYSQVGNVVTISFGNVTIPDTGSLAQNKFVLRFDTAVDNEAGNQAGTNLTPTNVQLTYGSAPAVSETDTTNNPSFTVEEPALTVSKTPNVTVVDGGDLVTYTIRITNSSTQMAYDVVLYDQLVALLAGDSLTAMNASLAGLLLNGSGTTATLGDFEFINSLGSYLLQTKSTSAVNIAAGGGYVEFKFTARISSSAPPLTTIANGVTVGWSSTDGVVRGDGPTTTPTGERNGSGSPLLSGTDDSLNDYVTTTTVNIATPAITLVKSIVSTSVPDNDGSGTPDTPDNIVTIGEVVRYRIEVIMPEGATISALRIKDLLPPGMQYLGNFVVETIIPGFNGTVTGGVASNDAGAFPFADGNDIIFTITSVFTTSDNIAGNNTFYIEFDAFVTTNGVNTDGHTLNNAASHNNADGTTTYTGQTPNVPVSVVLPAVTVTKSVTTASADAGDQIGYTVNVASTGTGTAFNTDVLDTISGVWFDRSSLSFGVPGGWGLLSTTPSGSMTTYVYDSGWTITYDTVTGVFHAVDNSTTGIAVGNSVQFTITVNLKPDVAPGTTVNNTAYAFTTSLPGVPTTPQVEYTSPTDDDDAPLLLNSQVTLIKALIKTDQEFNGVADPNVVIGEIATYDLQVTLQQGLTSGTNGSKPGVTIYDTLPVAASGTQLSYVNGTAFFKASDTNVYAISFSNPSVTYHDGDAILAGDIVVVGGVRQFRFLSVYIPGALGLGSGTFSVQYNVKVDNIIENQAGDTPTNSAFVRADLNADGDHDDGTSTLDNDDETSATQTVTLTIVEPSVTISNTITSAPAEPHLGDIITYEVVLTGGTAGTPTAFDAFLKNVLPKGVTPAQATLNVSYSGVGAGGIVQDLAAEFVYDPGTQTWTLIGQWDIPSDAVITITFQAAIGVVPSGTPWMDPTPTAGDLPVDESTIGGTYDTGVTDLFTTQTSLQWNSINGFNPANGFSTRDGDERIGNVGDTLDDYIAVDGAAIRVFGAELVVTKTSGSADWSATTPTALDSYQPGTGADTIPYTITITNTGTASARDVVLTDLFSSDTTWSGDYALVGGSFNVYLGVSLLTAGVDYTLNDTLPNGFTLNFTNPLATGAVLTINFNLKLDAVVSYGFEDLVNTATASFNQTLSGYDISSGTYTGNQTAVEKDLIDARPDLQLIKTATVTSVEAGDSFSYTITVTNVGNQDLASGFVLTEHLSEVLAVANFDTPGGLPPFGGIAVGGGNYTWALGALAGGSSGVYTLTLNFKAKIPLPVNITEFLNSADVPEVFGPDSDPTKGAYDPGTNPNGNSDEKTIILPTIPDLVIFKSVNTALIELNEVFTYTLVVKNQGNRSVEGLIVTDVLPDQLVFVSADGGGVYDPLTRTITWDKSSIIFNGSNIDTYVFTVQVYVPSGSTLSGLVLNSAKVDDASGPLNPDEVIFTNNTSSVTTPIRGADLKVTKDDGKKIVVPGESITYTMVVTNFGTDTAKDVLLKDLLPAHLTLGTVKVNGVEVKPTLTSDGFTIKLPNILAGSSYTITVETLLDDVVSAGFESMTNWVYVSHSIVDLSPENNSAFDTDVVDALPGLEVTKVASVSEVGASDMVTYTITVKNPGNQDASDVILTDDLDERIVNFLTATLGGIFDGNIIKWELGTIKGGGEFVEIKVTVQVKTNYPNIGQLINIASASFDEDLSGKDPTPDNNSATATITLRPIEILFQFDSFSNFATWRPFGNDEDLQWGWTWDNVPYRLPMLTLAPMYSGAADPGATLVVEIFNAMGVKVGTQSVVVDAGGNWLTTFASTILFDYPQTVVITETPPATEDPSRSGFNLRTYFSPAINSSHFFYQQPDVNKVMSQMPGQVLESLYEGAANPVRVGGEKYRYEFITAQGTPSS